MKKVYGFSRDEVLWKWRYEENPARKHYSHVAVFEDRVVAHCGGTPVEFQIGGKRVPGVQLADLMSDPEHRVEGAFTRAYLSTWLSSGEEGVRVAFGFGNPTGAEFALKRSKLPTWPTVPRRDRIVNAAPFVRRFSKYSLISKALAFPANSLIRMVNSIGSPRETDMGSVEEITAFDASFDELWEAVAADIPNTIVRTGAHLDWRYSRHPIHRYKSFAFFDGGKLRGYIVLRVLEGKGIRRGLIMDLISETERPKVWNSLLVRGIDYLLQEKVDLMTCWMFSHMPHCRTLKKLRFFDRPSDLSIVVRDFSREYDQTYLNDDKNNFVTMGDSDIF